MTTRPNREFMARVVFVSVIAWCLVITGADRLHAHWPRDQSTWVDFGIVCAVIELLGFKIFQMAYPTERWTRLAAALVLVNVGFFVVYCYAWAGTLWPGILVDANLKRTIRIQLLVFLAFCMFELLHVPGRDTSRPRLTAGLTYAALAAALVLAIQLDHTLVHSWITQGWNWHGATRFDLDV